jgi:hypothetical protein
VPNRPLKRWNPTITMGSKSLLSHISVFDNSMISHSITFDSFDASYWRIKLCKEVQIFGILFEITFRYTTYLCENINATLDRIWNYCEYLSIQTDSSWPSRTFLGVGTRVGKNKTSDGKHPKMTKWWGKYSVVHYCSKWLMDTRLQLFLLFSEQRYIFFLSDFHQYVFPKGRSDFPIFIK